MYTSMITTIEQPLRRTLVRPKILISITLSFQHSVIARHRLITMSQCFSRAEAISR